MKKINIYFVILLLLGVSWAQTSSAWTFWKKPKPQNVDLQLIEEEKQETPKTEEDVFSKENKEQDSYNVFDENEASLKDQIQEAAVEKNDLIDDEDTFSKDMELLSDSVDFYPETNQYVAKGNALLLIPNEQLQMYANEIIVDHKNYELTGIGNVRILKDGAEYYGDYIRFDTKRESSFFKNPIIYYTGLVVNSRNATMHSSDTVAHDGAAIAKNTASMIFSTNSYASMQAQNFFNPEMTFDSQAKNVKVKAKKIYVKRGEDNKNDILFKDATVYKGKVPVGYSPIVQIATDKDVNYVETIFPDMGSHKALGMYFAPGILFPMPKASTLKIAPLVGYDTDAKKFGIGGLARLSTPKSQSTVMYSSATEKFVINARYNFTKDFHFQFVGNDFMPTSWMGGQMPNYGGSFIYEKETPIPQANLVTTNYLGVGLFQDYRYDSNPLTTMRYKWQSTVSNMTPLLAWEKYLMLGYNYNHDFTVYQTGDTFGAIRVGPRLSTDLGRFICDITYFVGGETGQSPFYFDRYRYSNSHVQLKAQFYVNKYLSLGYFGVYNVTEPDWEGRRLTENKFIVSLGTEDVKLRFGWDTIRGTSSFGLDMLLGTNKTYMEFDEMHVQNLEPKENKKKAQAEKRAKRKKKTL